jgi:putative effector of murein hydrolase
MRNAAAHIWTPLSNGPLLWMAITVAAYLAGRSLQKKCHASPFANPVLIAILIVGAILKASGTPYCVYFSGAQFIHFLLGPATIALAIPLARNFGRVRENLKSASLALLIGSLTSIVSGIAIVRLFAGPREVALSMAAKAATTPIAIAVSQQVGGLPALTASLAILGGIVAAITGQRLLHIFRIRDWRAQGLAAGVAGSGIAAANISAQSEVAAAYAAVGVGMNGLLTALLVPIVAELWR